MLNVWRDTSFRSWIYIRILSKWNLLLLNTISNQIRFCNIYSVTIVARWPTHILLIRHYQLIQTALWAKELWVCHWVLCYLLELVIITKLMWWSCNDRLAYLLFIYHWLYFFCIVFCNICNTFTTLSDKTFES